MPSSTRVLKRCEKCGKTASVRPRVQHCYRPALSKLGTPNGYACWGKMTVVQTKPAKSKRDDYPRKLHKASHQRIQAITKLRRVAALVVGAVKPDDALEPLRRLKSAIATVERWQKRVNYYDAKIGEIAAAEATRTRRIVVGGDDE